MALETIDLDKIAEVQLHDVARQLVKYFEDNMATIIYCIPSEPKYLKKFVPSAIQSANKEGYEMGEAFSFHVATSFLLGLGWQYDPMFKPIHDILNSPDLDQNSRINYAMFTSIDLRKSWNKALPEMNRHTIKLLGDTEKKISLSQINTQFNDFVRLRNLRADTDYHLLRSIYEADFRQTLGLAETKPIRSSFSPSEVWARKNMGLPVEIVDTSADFSDEQRYSLLLHYHLSLSFGRFYLNNPLHSPLQSILNRADTSFTDCASEIIAFLQTHNTRLVESRHA